MRPLLLARYNVLGFSWPQEPRLAAGTSKRCPGAALPVCLLTLPTLRAGSRSDPTPACAPPYPGRWEEHTASPVLTWAPPATQEPIPSALPSSASASGLSQVSPTARPLPPPALLLRFHRPELRAHSASGPRHSLCLPVQRSRHPRLSQA